MAELLFDAKRHDDDDVLHAMRARFGGAPKNNYTLHMNTPAHTHITNLSSISPPLPSLSLSLSVCFPPVGQWKETRSRIYTTAAVLVSTSMYV